MSKKQEATKIIALTLAHVRRLETPGITEWGQAKILANTFESAGHIKPEVEVDPLDELIVYGYAAVDPEGKFITNFNVQQDAINYVEDAKRMAKAAGLASDYRVAAIVDQGGL